MVNIKRAIIYLFLCYFDFLLLSIFIIALKILEWSGDGPFDKSEMLSMSDKVGGLRSSARDIEGTQIIFCFI